MAKSYPDADGQSSTSSSPITTPALIPISIPGRASTTSWRTSSTYTSDYFGTSPTDSRFTSTTYCPRRVFRDSGYGTQNNTSNVSPEEKHNQLRSDILAEQNESAAVSKIKSTPLPGKEDLQVFKKDIDPIFTARYREVMPELHRLVQKQMSQQKGSVAGRLFQSRTSTKSKLRMTVPMSLRLMTVGRTINDAKPAIVIFTQGEQTSGLEALLRQPQIRQLYQPNDSITPSFEVIVVGDPARKMRYYGDVYAMFDNDPTRDQCAVTYCGATIRLETEGTIPSTSSCAVSTLGGVVKLTFGPGDFILVGMTAGHVLEDLYLDDTDSDESEDDTETLSNPDHEEYMYQPPSPQPRHRLMGNLLYPQMSQPAPTIPPRDWALFEMNTSLKIKPNIIPVQSGPDRYMYYPLHTNQYHHRPYHGRSRPRENCMTTAPSASFPSLEPIEVVMISSIISSNNTATVLLGELSHIPASIMLTDLDPENPDSEVLVQAYMLTLHTTPNETKEITNGHSGAWVVNPVSMEVYGHVVATDLTGDAYVVPLCDTFDEISRVIGTEVESVDLPTTADLLELALRNTANGGRERRRRGTGDEGDENRGDGLYLAGREGKGGEGGVRYRDGDGDRGVEAKAGVLRERRSSEIISLCDLGLDKAGDVGDGSDSDSGYGSVDTLNTPRSTPFKALFVDGYEAEAVEERGTGTIGNCFFGHGRGRYLGSGLVNL